jgi:hypothetical protein
MRTFKLLSLISYISLVAGNPAALAAGRSHALDCSKITQDQLAQQLTLLKTAAEQVESCYPVQAEIPFSITGGRVDTANIVGGHQMGSAMVGVAVHQGSVEVQNSVINPSTGSPRFIDGKVVIFASQVPSPNGPALDKFSGVLKLSPLTLLDLKSRATSLPYPNTSPVVSAEAGPAPCIKSVSVNMGVFWAYRFAYGQAYLHMSDGTVISLSF